MATVHIRRYLAATEWLTGPVWAVKTPYDPDFVNAIKVEIRAKAREWVKSGKIWVVAESQKDRLKSLIVEHFGAHEICKRCASGEPCWVWRSIDDEVASVGFKGASCGDADSTSTHEQPRAKQRSEYDPFREWWTRYTQSKSAGSDARTGYGAPPVQRPSNVMTLRDAAALLGVDINASMTDVKKAYARAAMQHHPDRGGDTAKMVRVNQAKEAFEAAWKRSSAGVRA